jgi:hypothetical protein
MVAVEVNSGQRQPVETPLLHHYLLQNVTKCGLTVTNWIKATPG